MDVRHLRELIDACFMAKRIVETLPAIPDGMKPRHFHVMDAIRNISYMQDGCRVSDVSTYLNTTTPSISRLIRELEEKQYVEKYADEHDGRVTYVRLTVDGQACVRKYVTEFHAAWAKQLKDISNKQAEETVLTISRLKDSMPGEEI